MTSIREIHPKATLLESPEDPRRNLSIRHPATREVLLSIDLGSRPSLVARELAEAFATAWESLETKHDLRQVEARLAELEKAARLEVWSVRALYRVDAGGLPKVVREIVRNIAFHMKADSAAIASFDSAGGIRRSVGWKKRNEFWRANSLWALLSENDGFRAQVLRQKEPRVFLGEELGELNLGGTRLAGLGILPLRNDQHLAGCLLLGWCEDSPSEARSPLASLETLSEVLLAEMDRSSAETTQRSLNRALVKALAEQERQSFELSALGKVSTNLHLVDDSRAALRVAAEALGELYPTKPWAIFALEEGHFDLVESSPPLADDALRPDPNECSMLQAGRGSAFVPGARPRCPYLARKSAEFAVEFVCIPLVEAGRCWGVIHIADDDPEHSRRTRELAHAIADRTAVGIANIQLRAELREQAIRDPLTGLYNRRFMDETFEREVSLANRNDRPIGLIMLDIDHFKAYNDRNGHAAGDSVLRAVGGLLRSRVRSGDAACRYGGEEFLVILPGSCLVDTVRRAEQIQSGLSELSVYDRGRLLESIGVSIGVAAFPDHGRSGPKLMKAVDQALYQAKVAGRNRVEIATEDPS